MTISSVRSNLVNFCPKKNLTLNNSKPIGVLTNTNLSYSVMHLPLGYLLHDFKLHRSNFLIHSLHFIHNQEGRGSTRWGGLRPPKPPRGGFEPKKMIWDDQSTSYLIFWPYRAIFKFTWDKSLEMYIKAFTLKNVLFLIFWGVFKENLPFFRGGGCL